MSRRIWMAVTFAAGLVGAVFAGSQMVAAQGSSAMPVAAVPAERGGQDIWGAYEPAADWPKELSDLPGHGEWTWGAGQSIFAESADRVYGLMRGELPNIERPRTQFLADIAPSLSFPIGRFGKDALARAPGPLAMTR